MLYLFWAVSPPVIRSSKTVHAALGKCQVCLHAATASVGELELTYASGSSKQAWHIPDAACTVFELLMMSGETARNMYSIDSNKGYCITLHLVGYT
jgi:hypothetical protein